MKNKQQDADDDSVDDINFNEESIVVTRQEETVDPEDEVEFEREYAKMMAESLESRKFERKPLFDVPLPVRPKNREPSMSMSQEQEPASPTTDTMVFSLLTKRGNRQQVCYQDSMALHEFSYKLIHLFLNHRPELLNFHLIRLSPLP